MKRILFAEGLLLLFLSVCVPLLNATGPSPLTALADPTAGPVADPETAGRGGSYGDIRDFGAKCNGVTDDSAAILAALKTGNPAIIPVATCGVGSAIWFGGGRIVGLDLTGSKLVWVGAAPSMPTAVTTSSVSAGVATVNTSAPHNLWIHETVVVQANSNPAFNGTFIVTSTPTPTSFTYALATANTSGSGGRVGMYYLLDSSKLPSGAAPADWNFNAGSVSNLTIDCKSTSGLSGLLQFGDDGEAMDLDIRNCVDGYTGAQTFMNPMSHVIAYNSQSQGAFIKNLNADNGAATGGSVWANGYGTYGVHIRGTQGIFDLLYAQNGRANSIYPFYFEGDGPGVTRTTTLECSSCVADSAGGINSYYLRRYYIQLDSPRVVTSGPSQNVFVFDDAWGLVNNADIFPSVAPGYYSFQSLGNTAGLTGDIVLMGGGGSIDPVNASDFTTYGFADNSTVATTTLANGTATAPVMSFTSETDLGWFRPEEGMIALGSEGLPVFSVSPGGVSTVSNFNLCSNPITGPCFGGFGQRGNDELVTLDHNGMWGGGNFTANMLKLGIGSTDTGISRIAPGSFAFGNGTQGDVSGTVYAGGVVVNGTSAPVGAAVCFKSDRSLGYCSTPFTGSPPTCLCN
jgi:hypothetical protein